MNVDLLRDLLVEGIVLPLPVEKPGPRQCCAEFSVVTECDGQTDEMYCGVCERIWTQPCVNEMLDRREAEKAPCRP